LSLYLDASVLVPLFVAEANSAVAQARISNEILFVSDFAATEFSAAIARRVRTGEVPESEAVMIFTSFDDWAKRATTTLAHETEDVLTATAYVRRLDLGLRAPDALHIALANRLGLTLYTFDVRMTAAAAALGIAASF
jgi:predicted nucleic acid-binding protein